ncbi:MAG: sugar phosphate nucleotidyltransferase [Akkermansiaceae bacterium]|jgi:mannose-1-phosphate guanylyltransferase|nr:sugar phosphate nucleotidyltransferase [Akkermansiaceae bacterium]MDP4645689.1 sugar phosphate nucleotidyltransferase [Akkermansiaceae bacterium]MDP4721625.1 sugar phosphate nucleotidyltransferase [Akkermansiaceae bacterium]MDP4778797.1 sugar phosphate nucleotidyltransferase [Akkermansiaceae bacterium]MDP4847001.1 sugar phosphate nucleotidyltransferase [Akkermansiaceae bacterium]
MIKQAFILGAGLGTRLRPLTDMWPKPLVPLFHKPLALWAVEACEALGCSRFAINTHHLPEKWEGFGAGRDVSFFHEPVLLETGGGLKNIEGWVEEGSLLIHNGDIFSSMDLRKLVEAHEASGDEVTLALRSAGGAKKISMGAGGRVEDVRSEVRGLPGTHVFTGIYCVKKDFLKRIPAGEVIAVIPAFQELVREGGIGGVVLDEGEWMDLGDVDSYLAAHRELALQEPVHPEAVIGEGAVVENSVIGKSAVIGTGARVVDSVVWPGATVDEGASVDGAVVASTS